MSSLITRDYKPGHLDCLEAKDVFSGQEILERAFGSMLIDPACHMLTLFSGKTPIAVLALRVIREGYAEVYSVVSVRAKRHAIAFHRAVRAIIAQYEERLGLRRIQMTVKAGHPENERWAESLGFQFEGVLRGFDIDGSDHVLFSRIKHG